MTIDEDGLTVAPWYVRAFIRVGMPTAFASILLWYLMTNVTGALAKLQIDQAEQFKNTAEMIKNQTHIIDLLIQNGQTQADMAGILSALCYNTADTSEDRARCSLINNGNR